MPASPPDRLLPELFTGLALLPGERLLSSLHIDIDDELRFAPGLLLLSDAHVHVRGHAAGFRSIPITSTLNAAANATHQGAGNRMTPRKTRTVACQTDGSVGMMVFS